MNDILDFSDLETDINEDGEFDPRTKNDDPRFRQTFTCPKCRGAGVWAGGRKNRHGNHRCWTCGGSGQVVTNPAKLQAQREKRRERKNAERKAASDHNASLDNGKLLAWAVANADWNNFCSSLVDQHNSSRMWSEKQVEVLRNMKAKTEKTRAANDANKPKADAARIRQMFDDALKNGKKRRALHAGHFDDNGELLHSIVLTPAREPRREIWVKVDGEFMGGIDENGTLSLRDAPSWLADVLMRIAANPDEECRLYGQRTGSCSCCGRELTNSESIDLGIGPICREKWGLG